MEKAIETPVEGQKAVLNFLMARTAAIPDDVRDSLMNIVINEASPVVASVNSAELIYARREELPSELLDIGAQLASMAANFNFHGFRTNDNRGYAIAATLRAMPGVSSEAPPASELAAPEPIAAFVPEDEQTAVEPPPEPAEVVTPIPATETDAGAPSEG